MGFFALVGLLMVAGAILARDGGAFGFALMVLGLGVGPLGLQIAGCREHAEERAARRSIPSITHGNKLNASGGTEAAPTMAPPDTGVQRRRRTTTRSSKSSSSHLFIFIPVFFAAACWAVGVGFMLFGYGPGQWIGGASRSAPVWVFAVLVWGGLVAVGVGVLVDFILDRRDKGPFDETQQE